MSRVVLAAVVAASLLPVAACRRQSPAPPVVAAPAPPPPAKVPSHVPPEKRNEVPALRPAEPEPLPAPRPVVLERLPAPRLVVVPPPSKWAETEVALGAFGRLKDTSFAALGWTEKPDPADANWRLIAVDLLVVNRSGRGRSTFSTQFALADSADRLFQATDDALDKRLPLHTGDARGWPLRFRVPAGATGLRLLADDRQVREPRPPGDPKGGRPEFIPFIDPLKAGNRGDQAATEAFGKDFGLLGRELGITGAVVADFALLMPNAAIGLSRLVGTGWGGPAPPQPVLSVNLGAQPAARPVPATLDGDPPLAKPGAPLALEELELLDLRIRALPKVVGKPRRVVVTLTAKNPTANRVVADVVQSLTLIDDAFRWVPAESPDASGDCQHYQPREVRTVWLVFPVNADAKTFRLRVRNPNPFADTAPVFAELKPDAGDAPPAKPGAPLALGKLELLNLRVRALPKVAGKPKRLEVTLTAKNPTAEDLTVSLAKSLTVWDDAFRKAETEEDTSDDLNTKSAHWPFYQPREVRTVRLVFPVDADAKTFRLRVSNPFADTAPVFVSLKP